jgi:hypothetical protein
LGKFRALREFYSLHLALVFVSLHCLLLVTNTVPFKIVQFVLNLVFILLSVTFKEQEVAEKADALKEASGQLESLKVEVTRLRRYEEELANLQVAPKNQVLLFITS